MSLRAYSRHRAELGLAGTTHRAIQKAVARGAIEREQDGTIDSERADAAWAEASIGGMPRGPAPAPRVKKPAPEKIAAPDPVPDPVPEKNPRPSMEPGYRPPGDPNANVNTLARAAMVEKTLKAKMLELEYKERKDELVDAKRMSERWLEVASLIRNRVLGLPSKIKGRLPHVSVQDVAVIDQLVREALDELSTTKVQPEPK